MTPSIIEGTGEIGLETDLIVGNILTKWLPSENQWKDWPLYESLL